MTLASGWLWSKVDSVFYYDFIKCDLLISLEWGLPRQGINEE